MLAQGEHAAAPALLLKPGGHASDDVAPATGTKRSAGLSVQVAAAALVCPAGPKRPAGQSAPLQLAVAALVCPTGPKRPAPHAVPVHGPSPLLECVPDAQGPKVAVALNPRN
jgi:hypothetical protein